jgi:hypothetical protein
LSFFPKIASQLLIILSVSSLRLALPLPIFTPYFCFENFIVCHAFCQSMSSTAYAYSILLASKHNWHLFPINKNISCPIFVVVRAIPCFVDFLERIFDPIHPQLIDLPFANVDEITGFSNPHTHRHNQRVLVFLLSKKDKTVQCP